MNKRSVYGNDMSRCSVFSDGEKIRYDKFVRFLVEDEKTRWRSLFGF